MLARVNGKSKGSSSESKGSSSESKGSSCVSIVRFM